MLQGVTASLGMTPNLYKVAAQSPAGLAALAALNGAISHGRLNAKTRESIALAVSEVNACDYCLSAHSALGTLAGLAPADIDAAREGRAEDPRRAAVVGFARSLVETRGQATDSELAALRAVGVTDGEVVEIVANVVATVFTNYLNTVAGTEIDFSAVHAGQRLAA